MAWRKITRAFELRFSFCQFSQDSAGVRTFLTQNYPSIKQANPRLPVLIRECEGTIPVLAVRYGYGEERFEDLSNCTPQQITTLVEEMTR